MRKYTQFVLHVFNATRIVLYYTIVTVTGTSLYALIWVKTLLLHQGFFLSRVSILMRDIYIGILSVRPSVRNVPVLDEKGLIYCHSFFHLTVA